MNDTTVRIHGGGPLGFLAYCQLLLAGTLYYDIYSYQYKSKYLKVFLVFSLSVALLLASYGLSFFSYFANFGYCFENSLMNLKDCEYSHYFGQFAFIQYTDPLTVWSILI